MAWYGMVTTISTAGRKEEERSTRLRRRALLLNQKPPLLLGMFDRAVYWAYYGSHNLNFNPATATSLLAVILISLRPAFFALFSSNSSQLLVVLIFVFVALHSLHFFVMRRVRDIDVRVCHVTILAMWKVSK